MEHVFANAIKLHLIIVNDGSSKELSAGIDYISKHIQSFEFIDHQQNSGKGHALKKGIATSKNPYCLYTDIDFPYTHDSMVTMINELNQSGASIIVGTRGDSYYEKIPGQRSFISKTLKTINKWLFKLPTSDTQGGLKAMDQKAKDLFIQLKTDRYLIDLEFLKKAKQRKLKVNLLAVEIRSGIELNEMPLSTLVKELGSYLKILFS